MKYTEEIFNILSKGGFISSNNIATQVKRYYDALEEEFSDYYDYYKGIRFLPGRRRRLLLLHPQRRQNRFGTQTRSILQMDRLPEFPQIIRRHLRPRAAVLRSRHRNQDRL